MKPFKVAKSFPEDLQQAYDYFGQGGKRSAERFWTRYKRTRQLIQANPLIARLRPHGWRQMPIPGSNYAIFYRESLAFWFLGGVFSTVQDPDLIQARLLVREVTEESAEKQ